MLQCSKLDAEKIISQEKLLRTVRRIILGVSIHNDTLQEWRRFYSSFCHLEKYGMSPPKGPK